jgi:dinuclear metal center protein, YbgI family
MIDAKKFQQIVEEIAPLNYQYEWDNSGWNIFCHDEIERVITCLDVTDQIVEEAVEKGCDTILSHHPMIFHAVKKILKDDPVTGIVLNAVKNNINVYCAHTSCDCSPVGLNLELAKMVGLHNPKLFIKEGEGYGIGFIGELEKPMPSRQYAEFLKEKLDVRSLKFTDFSETICKVAAVGGAAGEFFKEAYEMGAQALIVGEAKYNEFLDAKRLGIMLIEAGHFETEVNFAKMMRDGLQKRCDELKYNLTVETSERLKAPYIAI